MIEEGIRKERAILVKYILLGMQVARSTRIVEVHRVHIAKREENDLYRCSTLGLALVGKYGDAELALKRWLENHEPTLEQTMEFFANEFGVSIDVITYVDSLIKVNLASDEIVDTLSQITN